jgi:1-acyl-sn-glycerol-3-phosphate acyltransferase
VSASGPRLPLGVRLSFAGVAALVVPTFTLLTRRRFAGFEHLPSSGGCIVAANHVTEIDPLVLGMAFYVHGRPPFFLAKDKLFRPAVAGRVLRALWQIPVDRGGNAQGSLHDARRILDHGGTIVIYPEGTLTRDPDGWPMAGRLGAARLALATGAPLFPVAQWGAQEILAPYARRVRLLPRRTLQVRVGTPIDLSPYQGRHQDREALVAVTEIVMDAITGLLTGLRDGVPPATRVDPSRRESPGP